MLITERGHACPFRMNLIYKHAHGDESVVNISVHM